MWLKRASRKISEYYLQDVVNLNNDNDFTSYCLREKIEGLRTRIGKTFKWDGDVAFFHNSYYIQQTIIESYPNYTVLTDDSLLNKESLPSKSLVFTKNKEFCRKFVESEDLVFCVELDKPFEDIMDKVSFFIYKPFQGLSVLGMRKRVSPKYIGSRSIHYSDKHGYSLIDGVRVFEIGTHNYPLILALSECFEDLVKNA